MATVADLINAADTRASQALSQVSSFLSDLRAAATVEIDTGLPTTYNYASVPTADFPINFSLSRPDVSLPGVGAPPPPPTLDISALQPITVPDDDLLVPTHQFEYFEQAYQSTLLDPLKAKLLNDLVNGGYGIDSADEQALLQRARDREVQVAQSGLDETRRAFAARGFPLPPGELAVHEARAHQELQNKLSSVSREIFLDRSKRFVENRQFTIQQVRETEQILIGFHNSVQERALNVSRAAAEFAIAIYNALVARVRTRLEQAKIKGEVQVARFQAEAARAQAQLGVFQGQVSVFEANLRRSVESARLGVALYQADTAGNKAFHDTLIARTSLQQKVLEATVQQNIDISRLGVSNAQVRVQAAVAGAQLALEAAKGGATASASVLLGILNAVNTLAIQEGANV